MSSDIDFCESCISHMMWPQRPRMGLRSLLLSLYYSASPADHFEPKYSLLRPFLDLRSDIMWLMHDSQKSMSDDICMRIVIVYSRTLCHVPPPKEKSHFFTSTNFRHHFFRLYFLGLGRAQPETRKTRKPDVSGWNSGQPDSPSARGPAIFMARKPEGWKNPGPTQP